MTGRSEGMNVMKRTKQGHVKESREGRMNSSVACVLYVK